MSELTAAIAAIRFAYGFGRGYRGADTIKTLLAELTNAVTVPRELAAPSSGDRLKAEVETRKATPPENREGLGQRLQAQRRQHYIEDAHRRVMAAVASPTPFFERLVSFWSNHFTVSARNGAVAQFAGPFDIEAIRPHVMGTFEEMLFAAETHPAMLYYLDQNSSIGPDSPEGKKTGRGLNENLARETLELHTLGAEGGYDQADVRALAEIMAGWGVIAGLGLTRFIPRRAQPGQKVLLGKTFKGGQDELRPALSLLAHHPSTAKHIASKLARHFIGPDPPAEAVTKIEQAFTTWGGRLPHVYAALATLPESWKRTGANARNHFDFVVSALRASDIDVEQLGPVTVNGKLRANPLSYGALVTMGQFPWQAPSPAGWPEDADQWLTPAGLADRLNWIGTLVPHIPDDHADVFLERVLGPAATKQTRDVIAVASNRDEAIALVLASPEFNRR